MQQFDINNPFVSVVVPNYCHSRYLKQRLDSIINQTYQDFELIILDDCSPDNGASREVIEQYRSNPHVTHIVYNEQNSGSTFKQWHKGFSLAKGKYIWMAESDDYCEPTFLEELTKAISNDQNVAIAYATSFLVDGNGDPYGQIDISERFAGQTYNGIDFIKHHLCTYNGIWNASAVLFRKELAIKADKGYMEYKACGDHLFWIELSEMGKVIHISEKLNFFRIHTEKVTYNKSREGINHTEELKIYKYIKQKQYLNFALELQIFKTNIFQILHNEYNSDLIRNKLLSLWKSEGRELYYLSIVSAFLTNLKYYLSRVLFC